MILRARRAAPARRSGAAAVEFALVAPLLFLFVLGMIEVGRGMMIANLLNHAARVGCRAAAVPGKSNADVSALVNSTLAAQKIEGAAVTVLVNGQQADAAAAASGDEIIVIASVPVAKVTWLPGGRFLRGTLTGRFTLRRE